MSDTQAPEFGSGIDHLKQAAAAAGASGERIPPLIMKDKETVFLRFIPTRRTKRGQEDIPVTVNIHGFVKTRRRPEDYKGEKWPSAMPAVCRTQAGVNAPSCYICDNLEGYAQFAKYKDSKGNPRKPVASPQGVAFACLREPVIQNGEVVGFKDKIREFTRDNGDKVQEKAIVVVTQAARNFWAKFEGWQGYLGSLLLDDYKIVREGDDAKTDYVPTPAVSPDKRPRMEADGSVLDLLNPEHAKLYLPPIDFFDFILNQASEEYYNRFFDLTDTVAEEEESAKPETDVKDRAALDEMMARIDGKGTYEPMSAPGVPTGAPSEAPSEAPAQPAMRNFG